VAQYSNDGDVNVIGTIAWISFNILGLITTDILQMFSYAAAGFSAIAVGVYHIVKIKRIIKLHKHENKNHSINRGGTSDPSDSIDG
jgi:hypothetical protein